MMDGNRFSTSSNIYLQKILQYVLIMYMYSFNDSFNVSLLLLLLLFLVFMQAKDEEKKQHYCIGSKFNWDRWYTSNVIAN